MEANNRLFDPRPDAHAWLAEIRPDWVNRVRCTCATCGRTLGDLCWPDDDGPDITIVPRLKGQKPKRATEVRGAPVHGLGPDGAAANAAAIDVKCPCGMHSRVSDARMWALARRATQYRLQTVSL
jgi:hypothetical protein